MGVCGAGRALTLVGCVQPGNVDAVDLVHVRGGRHGVWGCDGVVYRLLNARARAFEQQLHFRVLSSCWPVGCVRKAEGKWQQ
jgi:hypothetical protein